MEQTEPRNNQQETIIDLDIPYMAGLFEGEGCFTILKNNPEAGKSPKYRAYTSITNTDPVLIVAVLKFLDKYGIANLIRKDARGGGHKDCYSVSIAGIMAQINFAGMMLPYLRGTRKALASLLIRYLTNRIKRNNERMFNRDGLGRLVGNGKADFAQEDEDLYREFKSIRGSSETTRVDPMSHRDKI